MKKISLFIVILLLLATIVCADPLFYLQSRPVEVLGVQTNIYTFVQAASGGGIIEWRQFKSKTGKDIVEVVIIPPSGFPDWKCCLAQWVVVDGYDHQLVFMGFDDKQVTGDVGERLWIIAVQYWATNR